MLGSSAILKVEDEDHAQTAEGKKEPAGRVVGPDGGVEEGEAKDHPEERYAYISQVAEDGLELQIDQNPEEHPESHEIDHDFAVKVVFVYGGHEEGGEGDKGDIVEVFEAFFADKAEFFFDAFATGKHVVIEGLQDFLIVFFTAMEHGKFAPGIAQDDAINAGVGLVAEDVFPGGAEGFLGLGNESNTGIAWFFGCHTSEDEQEVDDAAFLAGSCLKGKLDTLAVDYETGFKAVSV